MTCASLLLALAVGGAPLAGDPVETRITGSIEGRVVEPAGGGAGKTLLVVAVAGAGAAAAGVLAAGGSGTPTSSTATTTMLVTTTTLAAPTTTLAPTTTTAPAACTYQMSRRSEPPLLPARGGSAGCRVRAAANCSWSPRSDAGWVTISSGARGQGDGTIVLDVAQNTAAARSARVFLREDRGATCAVDQEEGGGRVAAARLVTWVSDLAVERARGQVVVYGAISRYHERGRSFGAATLLGRAVRFEASLVEAAGRPGTWRFELGGAATPGTLRVLAGDVVSLEPGAVVFGLRGRTGERIVFTLEAAQ